MDGGLSGMALGLVFGGLIGGVLGDAPIMVGGRESSSMCVTGSGSRRIIPEGKGSPFFLGALGGGGDLVGDGEGDLTGESEKDLLLIAVLEEGAGESFGDRGDWDGEGESLVFSGDSS